jgi:histone H2A
VSNIEAEMLWVALLVLFTGVVVAWKGRFFASGETKGVKSAGTDSSSDGSESEWDTDPDDSNLDDSESDDSEFGNDGHEDEEFYESGASDDSEFGNDEYEDEDEEFYESGASDDSGDEEFDAAPLSWRRSRVASGKKTYPKRKRKPRTRSAKAGLKYPVGRIARALKQARLEVKETGPKKKSNRIGKTYFGSRVSGRAPIFMAAVLEHIARKVLTGSGKACMDDKNTRITPEHIKSGIKRDGELNSGLSAMQTAVVPR